MARTSNRFTRGSALFTCRCCGRSTRDTGRGDNEGVRLCAECYDLAGEENHMADNGGDLYSSPQEVLRLISVIESKGGNASCWADLKAAAEEKQNV